MSELSPTIALSIAAVAVVIAIIAVIIAVKALKQARRAGRDYQRIANADSEVVDVLLDRISGIDASNKTVESLAELVQSTRDDLAHTLRHVAVVRYDAFRDLSGRLSFSVALLDDSGDGVILTGLHGRSESQIIAKGIKAASPDGLSPEEQQAVKFATSGVSK